MLWFCGLVCVVCRWFWCGWVLWLSSFCGFVWIVVLLLDWWDFRMVLMWDMWSWVWGFLVWVGIVGCWFWCSWVFVVWVGFGVCLCVWGWWLMWFWWVFVLGVLCWMCGLLWGCVWMIVYRSCWVLFEYCWLLWVFGMLCSWEDSVWGWIC